MIPIAKPMIGEEEIEAATRVLRSGRLAQGPEVEAFEQEFAEYIGTDHAVAVCNGTVSLQCAMLAAGFEGKRVHTTAFSFVSSATAIEMANATAVFHDISLQTFCAPPMYSTNISPTDGLLAVHLYGRPAISIAPPDVLVVEDCAQAIGSTTNGKKVGSFGVAGAFSFYATKNMTSGGEGGMVTTNHKSIADCVRLLRNHGDVGKYQHELPGFNFRMTELQATIGRIQLRKVDGFNRARVQNAEYYTNHIDVDWAVLPGIVSGHTFHQYVIRVVGKRRDFVAQYLSNRGIGCAVHYPEIIPFQPVFGGKDHVKYPVAHEAARTVLSIPVGPWVTEADREYIVETINGIP